MGSTARNLGTKVSLILGVLYVAGLTYLLTRKQTASRICSACQMDPKISVFKIYTYCASQVSTCLAVCCDVFILILLKQLNIYWGGPKMFHQVIVISGYLRANSACAVYNMYTARDR